MEIRIHAGENTWSVVSQGCWIVDNQTSGFLATDVMPCTLDIENQSAVGSDVHCIAIPETQLVCLNAEIMQRSEHCTFRKSSLRFSNCISV